MFKASVPRSEAAKYQVVEDDTIAKIVAEKCEDYDWKGFARYNWGTDVPLEVNRWLAETIGIKTIDANDPSKTVLKPADGMAAEVLIPKLWKQEGLAVDKLYTVAVRKRLPPVAVGISKLDKWFIPESESCDFKYELEGLEECADKVQFQVFASNYCKAEAAAEGTDFLKYKFTAVDVPVYDEEIADPKARTSNSQTGWKGKSNAADGVFKPRDAQDRYIDASQSPYTIHLRYFKDAADAQARIDLNPFWPLFEDGKPKAETLKVEWEIKDTSRLKYGRIQIFDKDGLIFEAPLPEAKLGQGKQSYEWDGKNTDGATEMKAENMPYRAQIQGHTGPDEKKGLALAAMQTEVRLFVHAELGTHPDKPWEDPQCLHFALAPCLPYRDKVADAPAKGTDQWYKWKLAQCGFHPGPAGADAVGDDFTNALKEFQRSYPKKGAAPHSRIKADGSKNADTEDALDDLAEGVRALFGKTSDLDDYTAEQAIARLIKPDKDMVVWAEDRHCYTAGAWKPAPAKFTTATYDMEDYRGGMSIGDNRPVRDAASVPRPWIPLEAYPALLSKSKPLEATAAMPAVTDEMRRAAGPLRVDWTFEEIGPQTDLIPDPAKRDAVNVVLANAAYGSFRLGYDGGNTADIPWNATTAAFTNALSNMAKIQGNKNRKKKVSVSGPDGGPWQIAFESGFVGPSVTTVTADGSALRGTDTDVKRVYTPGAGARKWTVTITGATGGTFKLSCDGQESGDIPYNADGDALRTILVQVPKIASGNKGPERTEVTGPAGGPWEVIIKGGTFGGVLVSNLTMNVGGLQPQATVTVTAEQMEVTRSKAFVKEIIEKETSAYTAKDGEKLLTNCPEKVHGVNCGIRPAAVAEYYKAPFGRDKTHSLLPWLAAADAAEKVVLTYMHADLGQDEAKVYPDFLGKAGVYLRPSRIAGDGYRFRAQISFKKDPGGADHPNREVLEKRYPKLPQANTAKMRVWRKASFRAYIGWVKTVEANWGQAMTDAANHYKPAHVHFVHEGPNPKTPQSFPAKGGDKIVTDAEFKDLIKERLAGSPYDAIKNDAKLEEGYVWPFIHKPHFGVAHRVGNLDSFVNWLYGTIEETSWDLYSKELIHLIITKIESAHGRMRGHVMAEFDSSPQVVVVEYTCDNVACGDKISEIVNDEAAGAVQGWSGGSKVTLRMQDQNCRLGCGGKYKGGSLRRIAGGIPLCAIGRPLGGSWLYTPKSSETWAHEMGHHRHFQHAQAYAGKNRIAPGGQVKQHDSAAHPLFTAACLTNWQKAWDRFCIMSYDKGANRSFCGKCILKNRGWPVEDIPNPSGDIRG